MCFSDPLKDIPLNFNALPISQFCPNFTLPGHIVSFIWRRNSILLISASALYLTMGRRRGRGLRRTMWRGGDSDRLSMWDSHAPTFNMTNYPSINPPKRFVPIPESYCAPPERFAILLLHYPVSISYFTYRFLLLHLYYPIAHFLLLPTHLQEWR